jgi:hypothetical protein
MPKPLLTITIPALTGAQQRDLLKLLRGGCLPPKLGCGSRQGVTARTRTALAEAGLVVNMERRLRSGRMEYDLTYLTYLGAHVAQTLADAEQTLA